MGLVRLENLWAEKLKIHKWTARCISKFSGFLAPSTLEQYNKYIALFKQFCSDQRIVFPPSVDDGQACVADFLNGFSERSERPESLLKTVTAALKHFFKAIGQELDWTIIDDFVKALIKCDTTRPAGRTRVMPIQNFMYLFDRWGPNEVMPLNKLRQKAVTAIALSAMCRPSDLAPRAGFLRRQLQFKDNGSLVIQFFAVKNDADRHGFEIQVDPSSEPLRDPVSCLRCYINRTATNVSQSGPVFITNSPPYREVSVSTISGMLRDSIREAGLSTEFTPRSFRPTGATAAVLGGVAPHTARSLGRWKTESVFFERYVYPLSNDSITDKMFAAKLD